MAKTAKLKRILNQIAIHTAGLLVIYAVVKQLGLTASIVLIGALALGYFTAETNESEAK